MTDRYYLPPQISYRICEGVPVFVDTGTDRYVQLTRQQGEWFGELAGSSGPQTLSTPARQLADRLVRRGLLISQAASGRPVCEERTDTACRDLVAHPAFNPMRTDFRYALAAGFAIASTARVFATSSLAEVVSQVRRWKSRTRARPDMDKQIRLAAKYCALTPYFIRSRDACRLHSAALVRFLSLYGERSDWIFGVRLNPFGAHCWVQSGETVLNDALDRVREHRAILAV